MKKILLVDDAAFMRLMCRDILGKNGYTVIGEAEDGEAGVEMYKKHTPDLVLMNITMPKMDGIQALRRIREHDPTARVVMLTAMGQSTMVSAALMDGARRFVVKPFQPDGLLEKISFVLGEENPSPNPFNRELLEQIVIAAHNNKHAGSPGTDILSQQQIDEIIRLTEVTADAPKEVWEGAAENLLNRLFMKEHDLPPPSETVDHGATHTIPMPPEAPNDILPQREINELLSKLSPDPILARAYVNEILSKLSPDPILNALEKIIAGQEKITALLEQLVEQQK